MNPSLTNEWPIKHRADACARTQRPFQAGEQFYTLLFREGDSFRREDLCEEAWTQRNENIQPFSFWKSRYEPPPPAPPEPLAKESAEELLRRLLAENNPAHANACYVLAVMLERKRVLKPVKVEPTEDRPVLIYEHAKTGDAFIVPDAQLRLDEIAQVQAEVSQLLRNAS
ncbi:MAG TPA: hypothetical protein VGW57_17405 [Chthoniobacterales bacterium]|nr:hypothetical protein [Chthoniobacterales bacterium]